MTRMQKKQLLLGGRRMIGINLIFAAVLAGCCWLYWSSATVPVAAVRQTGQPLAGLWGWRDVLQWGIPGLAASGRVPESGGRAHDFSLQAALYGFVGFLTDVDAKDMRSVLSAELPWLAAVSATVVNQSTTPSAASPRFSAAQSFAPDRPVVGIYHTHTAESFIPSTGVAHRPGGQIGEICEVGKALAETMEKNGIPALQDTTIHDSPSFMKAYGASEVTVTKMVKEHPSLQMVFDIHRDAEKRENVVAQINGESVAEISIIVAQGQKDLPQPSWRENYALAKLIDRKCNEKYPGLSRGIQLVEWRYNQHLHPHALLLEVGSHETSTEEGIRAMQLVGDVLTEILQEGMDIK